MIVNKKLVSEMEGELRFSVPGTVPALHCWSDTVCICNYARVGAACCSGSVSPGSDF